MAIAGSVSNRTNRFIDTMTLALTKNLTLYSQITISRPNNTGSPVFARYYKTTGSGTASTTHNNGFYDSAGNKWDLTTDQTLTPMHFGAAGDGTTDDSAAVVNAFASGANIFLPPNRSFLCNSEISIASSGIRIFGGGTILTNSFSPSNYITLTGDNVIFDNITIQNDAVDIASSPTTFIRAENVNVKAIGCTFNNITSNGLSLNGDVTTGHTVRDLVSTRASFTTGSATQATSNAVFINITGTPVNDIKIVLDNIHADSNIIVDAEADVTVSHCRLTVDVDLGLRNVMDVSANNISLISNTVIYSGTDTGISSLVTSASGDTLDIVGGRYESSVGNGLTSVSGASTSISGTTFKRRTDGSSHQTLLEVILCDNLTISGCTFDENAAATSTVTLDSCDVVNISGNNIKGLGATATGLDYDGCTDILISGNNITGNVSATPLNAGTNTRDNQTNNYFNGSLIT